jgi:hypothetical protein
MKLLKDVNLYGIKVDYFMWSEEKGEYIQPSYLAIDTETKRKDGTCANIIIFKDDINVPNLRVFDTEKEAQEYMKSRINNPCYCENQRVIKIKYDFENGKWEEC